VRLARPRMTGPVIPTKAGYVVTRSRPYLARRSREVLAVESGRETEDAMSSHPYPGGFPELREME
jgi:hypothetical protein